jgi:ABC-2 type transport system permease protein
VTPAIRVALLIAAKDLRQRLRDRSALLVSIVAPLGLAVIFSQLLGSSSSFSATYAVADLDGGELGTVFREQVLGSVADGPFTIVEAPTEEAARAAVDDGSADAAFIIPPGFTMAIRAGQAATLEVVGARDEGLATEVARALAQAFGDGVVKVQLAVATAQELAGAASPDPALAGRIAAAAASDTTPAVALIDASAEVRQLSAATYFAASMAILFLFFSTQMGLVSLFEERRAKTLGRSLVAPLRPEAVLGGKALGSFLQGALALAVLVVATTLLIGARWGDPVGVALVCASAILAAMGISLLVMSFASTAEAAGGASAAVAITLAILGGTFTPSAQAPEAMQTLALLTPHGWFLRGLGDLQGSAPLSAVFPSAGALLLIAVVTGGIGMVRARRLVRAA